MKKPFIYKFKSNNKYYVYDVNTNNLLLVDKKVFYEIDSEKWNENKSIIKTRNNGLLLSDRPNRILEKVSLVDIKEKLKDNIQMITLFVTSKCNMACKYCYFSDSYDNEMKLKNKNMNFEIAKKAIDFYFLHSNGNRNKNYPIGFYGGEPFVNFNLMQSIVSYVKKEYKNKYKDVIFTVTTNLTILNKEILNFLISNNVHVAVSLDGPKEIHNGYRILKNGLGTYEIVMKNLDFIYKHDQKYFFDHVVFNVVLAPPINFIKSYRFFSNKLFSNNSFAKIGLLLIDGSQNFEKKYKIKIDEGYETIIKLFKIYKEYSISGKKINNFLSRVFDEIFIEIHNREMFRLDQDIRERGACIPGMIRPMVDEDGNIYPCEKGGFIKIGDIHKGFDYQKCYKLVTDFAKVRNEICLDCWAIRFCSVCYIDAEKDGRINKEKKLQQCEDIKNHYSNYLKRYVEIMEKNPNTFDWMRKWALEKQKKELPTL